VSDEKVARIPRAVQFTIDGRGYETTERKQQASALLRLVELDPGLYDLGELHGQRPKPVRYADTEIVEIHPGARFVSIRQRADVA
jgi:hypothetical protein